ncbi:hypothetical protein [Amycolatopsis nigrescens]|uniref:hypothetical protein n=1 Tax=Amycolatopsis nigrescens TaxID=381445 RepID=UPI00036CF34B|nr:hypothetical protein [Amycolatopsis nigrescens]
MRGSRLAVLLLLAAVLAGCAAESRESARRPRDVPLLRALVSADGLQVTVEFDRSGCGEFRLTADEGERAVSVHLVAAPSATRGAGAETPRLVPCTQLAAMGTATVRVGTPVAGRALVDTATGRELPSIDGRTLAAVGYLPAGYVFARDSFETESDVPPRSPQAPLVWTRVFTGPPDRPELRITQAAPGGPELLGWPVTATVRVGGADGQLHLTEGGAQALTWVLGGLRIAVYTVQGNIHETPLPVAELEAVAAALRPA